VAVHRCRRIADRLNERWPWDHGSSCRDRAATGGSLQRWTGVGVRDLPHDRASGTWMALLDLSVGHYERPDRRLEAGVRSR
jgi:hypothetical protein